MSVPRYTDSEKWICQDVGDGWAQPNYMFGTKPTGDPRTLYQYHLYYKHDGIIDGKASELLYPQWENGRPFFYMNSRDGDAEELLDTYVYQAVHHVPLFCGELGGSINNPNQEVLLWLEDRIELMERMGHGWMYWWWGGKGYGRCGLRDGDLVSPNVLVLKRFLRRRGVF